MLSTHANNSHETKQGCFQKKKEKTIISLKMLATDGFSN